MKIVDAIKEDAADLAYLINLAGEGIPEYLWSGMVEDSESPFDVGKRRAAREEGGFSYKNARVIKLQDSVAGMIISYQLDDPYIIDNIEEFPDVVRPLVLLEEKVPGSWYINAIATKEEFRGRGVAHQLMIEAESKAKSFKARSMSLIVASENVAAKNLYLKLGYEKVHSLPVVEYPNSIHGGDWDLMIKKLESS
ncbi:GNAT family N-acetyltransferase [Vibrio hannami]|uniref:GNAT family N-acetyltransferase n=1 Tax=Vibrio hannami TaxID=2717094 RepID=UPI00240EA019|nr:GNAT family N-acetyltransferase [Vibrio hannami]MDG3085029.1 GNAT family N-acetyltransferase [Vibrio hannami]